MAPTVTSMQPCIEACTRCHHICLQTAMAHCLQLGGQHVAPNHFTLMLNCAEVCQTAANLQLGASPFVARVCALCAEVCEACASSCEAIGDMDECAAACRQCADSCTTMAAA